MINDTWTQTRLTLQCSGKFPMDLDMPANRDGLKAVRDDSQLGRHAALGMNVKSAKGG